MIADTHCHIYAGAFETDRTEVIRRAEEGGVKRMMTPGIDMPTSEAGVALADRFDSVYAAVGVHPHDAETLTDDKLIRLREMAAHHKVRAIGEIGLDYFRNLSPRQAQRQAFEKQLGLAAELRLPVIIHCRDAHDDVLTVLATWGGGGGVRGVLHSFSGDKAHLSRALDLGLMIGITGPITFPKAIELREVAAYAPWDSLLIETDAPYLTPEPHRGKRNEPAYVRFVAERLAEVRKSTLAQVAEQTSANANRIFDWSFTD